VLLPTTTLSAPGDTAGSVPTPAPTDLAGLVTANQTVLEAGLLVDEVPSNLRPSLRQAFSDKARLYPDDCVNIGVDDEVKDCRYGTIGSDFVIVLYGDSHAAHWFPALEAIATERSAELVVFTKGGCPTATVSIPTNTLARTCPAWRDGVIDRITALRPDMIVMSASAYYPNSDDEWRSGMEQTVGRLADSTDDLVILGDNPGASEVPATCLSAHLSNATRCTNLRERAVEPGRITVESTVADQFGGRFIDTTDWLCTAVACPVILGDILLYRDVNHLSTTGAMWLRPLLQAALFP